MVHGLVAIPIENYVTLAKTRSSNCKGGHNFKYQRHYIKQDYYAQSFFPRTIVQWNQLPNSVVNSETIDQFKSNIASVNFSAMKY